MKRILWILGVLFFVLIGACNSFAASEYKVVKAETIGKMYYVELEITADESDGSVDDITIANAKSLLLHQVGTWPGSPPPKDLSDIAVVTSTGSIPLLGGLGTDLIDATSPLWTHPKSNVTNITGFPGITGNVIVSITQASPPVNGAIMNIRLIFLKP